MKLIPYPSLRFSIPAIALVSVNITEFLGATVQILAIVSVFAVFFRYLRIDLRTSWVILLYVTICLGVGVLNYGAHQAVIKAGKLGLFCLASVLSVRGVGDDKSFPALIALRAFFILCGLNFLYAAAIGSEVFRASHFIEFSIYSSYTIALLVYFARSRLTIYDRGFAWAFSLLCGSTTGLVILMLAEVVGRNLRPRMVLSSLALAPIGLFVLNFLMKARGKELTLEYLANSDRAVIIKTFYESTMQNFTAQNWLFGIGVGTPLHSFISPDPHFDNYLRRVGEGEIYSYCLHNEPLHILCDFGLIGLLLVCLRLHANCRAPVLILLGICMMTNAYIYSFSGALIASSFFNRKPVRSRKNEATRPETQQKLQYV